MLTVSEIKGVKPKANPFYIWDSDKQRGMGKLGVQVTKASKRFVFRYFNQRKATFIRLGVFPEMSLVDARAEVRVFRAMLAEGKDPKSEIEGQKREEAEVKAAEAMRGSFQQLVESYVQKMKDDGKRTWRSVLKAMSTDVYSVIPQDRKAKDVTSTDIKLVLAKMIQRGAIVQSNKVRSYLHAAFNYGLRHDNDPANMSSEILFGISFNPVTAVPKQPNADKVGDRWLTWSETSSLLGGEYSEHFRQDVEILIKLCFHLGGQRPIEVMSSKWESVNFKEQTFEIVGSISKNGLPNLIPLTGTAMDLFHQLRELSGSSKFLFPCSTATGHLESNYFSKVIRLFCKRTGFSKFVPRDIRRTVKTLAGDAGLTKEIRDRIQNHALNDVSSKHYDRYDYMTEKRRALEQWESRLLEIR